MGRSRHSLQCDRLALGGSAGLEGRRVVRLRVVRSSVAAAIALACAAACGAGDVAAPESPPGDPTFDAPSTYVAKVKNVLVGLPPSDEEVRAVEADPNALGDLVE